MFIAAQQDMINEPFSMDKFRWYLAVLCPLNTTPVVSSCVPDAPYNTFYQEEDYPVVKYLKQPLHFEVELTRSSDPKVALMLDHCWATLNEDRDSRPRWNLIING